MSWCVVEDRQPQGGSARLGEATRVGKFSEQNRGTSKERHHRVRVFVAGGTGHCGSCNIPELITARHAVTALARSDKAAVAVFSVEVHRDAIQNLEGLEEAPADSDDPDDHLTSGLRLRPP